MIGELTPAHRSAPPQQPEQFVLDFDIRISKTFPSLCIQQIRRNPPTRQKTQKRSIRPLPSHLWRYWRLWRLNFSLKSRPTPLGTLRRLELRTCLGFRDSDSGIRKPILSRFAFGTPLARSRFQTPQTAPDFAGRISGGPPRPDKTSSPAESR